MNEIITFLQTYFTLDQIALAFTGVTAIYLTQSSSEKLQKYASIFGLLGQPFWFYTSYTNSQWGIFILCFLYSHAWLKGFIKNWVKPYIKK